jgi:hypothetical protein
MSRLKTRLIAATFAAATLSAAGVASAGVVDLTFTPTDGSGVVATLQLTVTGPNGFGGEDVTDITGDVTGGVAPGTVTGIAGTVGLTAEAVSPDGLFIYDNWYYTSSGNAGPGVSYPHGSLDNGGLLFDVNSGGNSVEYNLFWLSTDSYELVPAANGGYLGTYFGTVAVPEPAMWALMLVGFAGVGATLRGARKRTLAAA